MGPKNNKKSTHSEKPSNETIDVSKKQIEGSAIEIKNNTKNALKDLKKALHGPTIEARRGKDRPSVQHEKILNRIEEEMKTYEIDFNKKLAALNKNAAQLSYKEILDKSNYIIRSHKEKVTSYGQALTYAILAIAGPDKKLESEDYALFSMVIDNITKLHEVKGTNLTEVVGRIKQGTMTNSDLRYVCKMLKKHEYREKINNNRDKITGSVTALFVRIMNPYQRYEALKMYSKLHPADESKKLIDAFTKNMVITIKQREELLSEVNGTPYRTSVAEEKKLIKSREIYSKLREGVQKKMNSAMAINGAERIINARSIFSAVLTGIGAMGMVTNYMIHFNSEKKWSKKLTAGLTKPHFWIGTAVAATGIHFGGKSMTPGANTGGLFDKISKGASVDGNLFGYGDKAIEKNNALTSLAHLSSNYSIIENWMVNGRGFNTLDRFLTDKKRNELVQKKELKFDTGKEKPKAELADFSKLEKWLKANDREGYLILSSAKKRYGIMRTKRIYEQLLQAHNVLGITNRKTFEKKGIVTYGQNYSYKDVLRYRQGLKPLTVLKNTSNQKNKTT